MEKWVYFDETPFRDKYGLDLLKQGDTFKEGENLIFKANNKIELVVINRYTRPIHIGMNMELFNKLFVSEVDYKTFNPAWLKFKKEHTYEDIPF